MGDIDFIYVITNAVCILFGFGIVANVFNILYYCFENVVNNTDTPYIYIPISIIIPVGFIIAFVMNIKNINVNLHDISVEGWIYTLFLIQGVIQSGYGSILICTNKDFKKTDKKINLQDEDVDIH